MESNPELTTLSMHEIKSENPSVIQRGAFLTRRFFGGKSKDAVRTEGNPGADAKPPAVDANQPDRPTNESSSSEAGTPRESLIASAVSFAEPTGSSWARGTLAYGPDPLPAASVAMQPVEIDATADAAGDAVLPEYGPPAPPAVPSAGGTSHSPEPRMTLPSTHLPQTTMTPTQTSNDAPATGRASAQLTLGFEITSLRLTPFFRVGSVQLKALSNVVSLSLIATQGTNSPLAAGISFQIERVELDGAAHLQSILLKPLGESREVVAPQSELRVDSVGIDGEGAPISVATSGAASTAVQLIGTFLIAAMEFSPSFEIDSLRLELVSSTVRVRITPSSDSDAEALRSSFELAEVQLGDGAQISGARLVPSTATNA